MAKKITNVSSGVYFRETDLTFITKQVGTFAGGAIVLAEKGPAFEAITSSSKSERTTRLGGLNPKYKSSYFANEFLAQANNYKEARILGKEGYNENENSSIPELGGTSKSFAIAYDNGIAAAAAGDPIEIINITGSYELVIEGDHTTEYVLDRVISISGVKGIENINGNIPILSSSFSGDETTIVLDTAATDIMEGTYTGGGYIATGAAFSASNESIAAILKPRRGQNSPYPATAISYVTTSEVEVGDGAKDNKFKITVYYEGNQETYPPIEAICSLRPDSSQYISSIFGKDPLDGTTVKGNTSPLWVELVFPSVKRKLTADGDENYYYPISDGTGFSNLDLVSGNITIDLNYQNEKSQIVDITNVPGDPVEVELGYGLGFGIGDEVTIEGLIADDPTSLNGNFIISSDNGANKYNVTDKDGNIPETIGSFSPEPGKFIRLAWSPTWEDELLTLGGSDDASSVEFQTPTTPWFVDNFDENGIAKRLFRLWSISDGEAANTEIKVEITNVDSTGNGNYGSFDLYVRVFSDSEDKGKSIYEGYPNLTMNPKSSNYILRRIGDGENFPLRSKFIFVELNENEILPARALPYGVEGYTNVDGLALPDVFWSTNYDLQKSVSKQTLGLAHNNLNMFKKPDKAYLVFKNVSGSTIKGVGFHLNPNFYDPEESSTLQKYDDNGKFAIVDPSAYNKSNLDDTKVTGLSLVRRMKYVVDFEGGFDGWNVYNNRTWDDITSKDYEAFQDAIEVLSDPEDLTTDFSVLVTPDINYQTYPVASAAVLEMVERRGDALYLFDFDYKYLQGEKPEIVPESAAQELTFSNMLSSYAATYYPDLQISDDINNINVWCPPSIVSLATIARTALLENVWQPPAGSLRTVTDSIIRTRKRMKLEDRKVLKKANINPITIFPGSGFEITESRTTQEEFSALSFIHNRLLLGYAKKTLNQVLRPLLHQLKSENLKSEFKNTITPIFERIKKLNGLETFEVSVDGSDEDRTTLNGVITIVPLYPVERIIVDFVLKDGGLDFNQ
jgi:hypothetical protein